jgi:hypothetical protein
VHSYIESGSTEYNHLRVVAGALEMMGGRLALVEGKVPQRHLSKAFATYGTVNISQMTREEKLSYQQDIDKRRLEAFVDAHCGMKVRAYYDYIIKTPKDQQREPKCKGCTLSFQMRKGGGKERVHHQHKWE